MLLSPRGALALHPALPGVTFTFHAPASTLRTHRHEHPYLTLLLRGEYTEETSRGTDTVRAGDAVIHPGDEQHGNRFSPSGAVCLNLPEQHLAALSMRTPGVPTLSSRQLYRGLPLHFLSPALGAALLGDDAGPMLDTGLRRVFHAVAFPATTIPAWLRQADPMLHRRFRERCGLGELARGVGHSPAHLARHYRRAFGCTVGERIRSLRVEWAIDSIRESREPLARIAAAAGFTDQAHLSRAVRRATGRTPSALRKVT